MFEKEAEEKGVKYTDSLKPSIGKFDGEEGYSWSQVEEGYENGFKDGAEFGYNKANEWHYVKDGLPKESGKYLVCVGGVNGVFVIDFETEYNDFGYWCLEVASDSLGVTDTVFETITERNEDKVIAWKEIVLPKESE